MKKDLFFYCLVARALALIIGLVGGYFILYR